jgi:predicted Zn-dependent peptidase
MEFKNKTLDNGLDIIAETNNSAQSAAVGFFVRTGARDETADINGVSHFLEHMMFKGTDKLSWMDVNQAFDETGAQFNAFTSEENTVYYAAVLPEYLEEITDLWAKLMRPSLRDEDFDMEKNVIKEEIAMYKDAPQFDIIDQARTLHFGDHPCGNSVLGSNESIDALTAKQMRGYFAKRYAPDNIIVTCAGNLDFDKICDLIETKTKNWTASNPDRQLTDFAGTLKSKHIENPILSREHICLVSQTVSMQDERKYAASLLSTIAGDTTGSRFFWQLVDTALAEDASMHCETMDGTGAMYTYIRTGTDKKQKVMDITNTIFKDITENGITEDELQTAKNKILSAITIKNEVPMGRLVELGFNWVYLKKYNPIDKIIAEVKNVTVDDINTLAKDQKLSDYTIASTGPSSK